MAAAAGASARAIAPSPRRPSRKAQRAHSQFILRIQPSPTLLSALLVRRNSSTCPAQEEMGGLGLFRFEPGADCPRAEPPFLGREGAALPARRSPSRFGWPARSPGLRLAPFVSMAPARLSPISPAGACTVSPAWGDWKVEGDRDAHPLVSSEHSRRRAPARSREGRDSGSKE
jgi:hypothetical protein